QLFASLSAGRVKPQHVLMAQIRIYGRSDDIVLSTELREERQASRRLRDVSQHVAGFIEAGEATRLANGKVEHCWRLPESGGVVSVCELRENHDRQRVPARAKARDCLFDVVFEDSEILFLQTDNGIAVFVGDSHVECDGGTDVVCRTSHRGNTQ